MPEDRLVEMGDRLSSLAEELADLALDRLRAAADPEDPGAVPAAAQERRITRARRAVEKAAALLRY
jgi:hypothetical protein